MGIYESSGHRTNPLGGVALVVGILGAAASVILWIHHFQPETTLLGSYSAQLTSGGSLPDQLRLLAMVFGVFAVVLGIAGGLGGRGSGVTFAALLLGIVALSYPVLTYLEVVTRFVPNPVG